MSSAATDDGPIVHEQAGGPPNLTEEWQDYYVTRDRDLDGTLQYTATVWGSPPRRFPLQTDGPGAVWMGSHAVGMWHYSLNAVYRMCGTWPEDDRQCLKFPAKKSK